MNNEIKVISGTIALKRAMLNALTVLESGPKDSGELAKRVRINTRTLGKFMALLVKDAPDVLESKPVPNNPMVFTLTMGANYDLLRSELAKDLGDYTKSLEVELSALLKVVQHLNANKCK